MQAEPCTINNAEGCRRLLAAILKRAVLDANLTERPDRSTWPWSGWHPADELQAFCQSDWFTSLCLWLDLDADKVRAHIEIGINGCQKSVVQLQLWPEGDEVFTSQGI